MKKLSIFLLALVASAGTMFASNTSVDGIWYNFNDGNLTAEVTYQGADSYSYPDEYSGEVVIPSSVTYNAQTYTVTSIGGLAFWNCTGLTSVTIGNSVTSIGDWAFYGCSDLTSVTIPNSVTSIGDGAFAGCTGLTSVTIGNSVTSIGDQAFEDCTGLTSPVYNAHVFAFMPTSYSGAYTIPDGIESIARYAFSGCTGLTSVTIGNSVTSIGSSAFSGCDGLTSIEIPNSVTSIEEYSFSNCSSLTSVTIPNSVTSIGEFAFSWCTGLTTVTIPNSVTFIGDWAFRNCSNLTSVTNYATTPQSINSNVFTGVNKSTCVLNVPKESVSLYQAAEVWKEFTNIVGVDVPKDNYVDGIWYNFDDGNLTAEVTYRGDEYDTYADEYSGEVVIPASVTYNAQTYTVTSIGRYAFYECYGLTSVTIPNSITSIRYRAFYECTGLTSVTIPNSVTSIGNYAFRECSGLTSVTIPNSVTSIGNGTFEGCSGLTSVTIPNSITSIGYEAFYKCSGLTSITCEAITPPTLGFDVFYIVDKSIPLYVPAESVEAYQTAYQWKDFTNIIGLDDGDEEESNIRYIDPSNNELGSETVSLHLPDVPEIEGFTFLKWQVVAGDLEEGIIIQAVYQADESTSASSVYTNPANPAQKLIRNGNVYILSNEKTYSLTGAEVIVP